MWCLQWIFRHNEVSIVNLPLDNPSRVSFTFIQLYPAVCCWNAYIFWQIRKNCSSSIFHPHTGQQNPEHPHILIHTHIAYLDGSPYSNPLESWWWTPWKANRPAFLPSLMQQTIRNLFLAFKSVDLEFWGLLWRLQDEIELQKLVYIMETWKLGS